MSVLSVRRKRVKNQSAQKKSRKNPKIHFPRKTPEARKTPRGGPPVIQATRGRAQGPPAPPGRLGDWPHLWCPTLHIFIHRYAKTMNIQLLFLEGFPISAAIASKLRGTRSSCSGTLSGRGSAPRFISIDVASSLHDAGVVPPRGRGLLPVCG